MSMTPDGIILAAFVILLFPSGFFLLSAPAFLLVKLDIPEVTQLLRGLFSAYFLMMGIAAIIAAMASAAAGQLAFAMSLSLIAVAAFWGRGWFLRQMDSQLRARDAGDADAVRRLRRLHWQGMLCNAIVLVAFIGSVPYITRA
jgi:hypothetical protein